MLPVALALLAAVAVFLLAAAIRRPTPMERTSFLAELDEFIAGNRGAEDWDEFCDAPVADEDLAAAQRALSCIDDQYPAERPGALCNEKGLALLRRYRDELREARAA